MCYFTDGNDEGGVEFRMRERERELKCSRMKE